MDTVTYQNDWMMLIGGMPPCSGTVNELGIAPYLKNKGRPAKSLLQGLKDTIQIHPGEVTIIRVRFAPTDGCGTCPFNPTSGPGFVWHCHIIDHEDNEMMRPCKVVVRNPFTPSFFSFLAKSTFNSRTKGMA